MGTLSEHLCLCDSRGSNTLSECSNVDWGKRQLLDTTGKKFGRLLSLSFTSNTYFQHLISARKFLCLRSCFCLCASYLV
jgi:hypothetical protein